MNLFNFRYRIPSVHNPFWNYRSPGLYFVTICTKFRVPYFGSITNGHIELSPIGKIVEFELDKTTKIRNNVVLDEWAIMPNHVHVIIRILPPTDGVATHRGASLQYRGTTKQKNNQPFNRFGPQSENLQAIVRGFKSEVKKWTNLYGLEFRWQMRYYDHIIRDDSELKKIQWYIRNNARVWKSDSMNR